MVLVKLSPHQLEWVKFGVIKNIAFVGKDVLCIGMNMMILFYNVNTKEEVIYRASDVDVGEGVHFLTGHGLYNIFAFAECTVRPRIFIKTFPEFAEVCTLCDGTNAMYTSIQFSEFDFFISLDGIPDFTLTVWNWRNGEKVSSINTDILSETQLISSTKTTPVTVSQMEQNGTRLKLWEILMCGKRCVLNQQEVTPLPEMQPLTAQLWTTDGALFVLDSQGDVYTVNSSYIYEKVITWETPGICPTHFIWYKGGITIAGPNGEIKHFKKVGGFTEDWVITPPEPARKLVASLKEVLVIVSERENIFQYNPDEESYEQIRPNESQFNDICLIYPLGDYIVSLAHKSEIALWRISTGDKLDVMELPGIALNMASHKELPYVGISFAHGLLLFIRVNNQTLEIMKTFHLTRNPLNRIYFADFAPIIVACDMDIGQFFVLEGTPNHKLQVIATVTAHMQIVDFILIASKTCFRLFAIVVTTDKYVAGCKFIRFCIIKGRARIELKEYELHRSHGITYEKMYSITAENRDRVFYAMPYSRKDIHQIEIKRGEPFAKITQKIHINHQMRSITIQMDDHHFLTYAYDGLVMVRSTDWTQQFAVLMTHHRRYMGVYKAYVDPLRRYIVALGRDNTLVCMSLTQTVVNETKRLELMDLLEEEEVAMSPSVVSVAHSLYPDKVWLEIEDLKLRERERQFCDKERKSIIASFKNLRKELRVLLTKNIEGPDNEKLDVQEFNLDEDTKTRQIYDNEMECEYTKKYLEEIIIEQDAVTKWIKNFCWDQMYEQEKSIWAIFGNFDVSNYSLLPPSGPDDERQQCLEEQRIIELLLSCEDSFEPWLPIPRSIMREHIQQDPKIATSIPTPSTTLFLSPDEAIVEEEMELDAKEEKDMETTTAFAGSITHTFIQVEKLHYSQQQIQSFAQMIVQRMLTNKETFKVKVYFNKEFENLMSQKVREINNVKERNARLRHILSEFNYFSEEKLDIDVIDPDWKQTENPELIIKVEDNEVDVTPYISPSEQAILDAIAAEQERLRLLMLADDFKERALYAMMWGVLEIRWEDELRKDVPKPKCMLEKEPENYNEDDLRAIKDYEEKVKFLNSERERYKKILTMEYLKLGNTLREGVKKFNGRLTDLHLLKIRVDTAIGQENLRISRMRAQGQKRINTNIEELHVQAEIKAMEKGIDQLAKLIQALHENLNEVKAYIDGLQSKEKILERNFKKEFIDANPVALEQINKLYKKRPKTNIRSLSSITLLIELSRCLVNYERSIILIQECVEFLKAVDNLDLYVGVSNMVEEHMYANMCRLRRLKIENEIKIKAAGLELVAAENTIVILNKLLHSKKEHLQSLLGNLASIRHNRIKNYQNIELQLTLKQGFVEVPTTGAIADFNEAILVSRDDVAEINKMIVKVGNKKLKAMRETMEFRRGILAMEWEHKRMKMRICDLKNHIKDIFSVKVTKEIQTYLKMKAKGVLSKELSFEQEITLIKKSYERIIEERKAQVKDLQEKIRGIKHETHKLNNKISNINVDVCEYKLEFDEVLEQKEKDLIRIRMATLLKRAKLVKMIQENHNEILVLQTELELLRLKTYPTLKFKVVT